MKDFSFIVLTYNHDKYIVECLKSIVDLILNFGDGIDIDLIIADDHSTDNTPDVVEGWIENNRNCFRNCILLRASENRGVVRNLLNAIDHCQTDNLKFIGGDDKFISSMNLFELFDKVVYKFNKPQLTITPIVTFGEGNNEAVEKEYRVSFRVVEDCYKSGKLRSNLKNGNMFSAPGVFIPKSFLVDEQFRKFLLKFRNIEDYPMWYYMIIIKNYDTCVYPKSFVQYRIGSGMSANKKGSNKSNYNLELKYINKLLHVRNYILPKYINPFRYLSKFLELKAIHEINKQ